MVVATMTWRAEAGATQMPPSPQRRSPGPSRKGRGSLLRGMISYLASWCGSAPWAGGLLVGLFVAGAAGSTMHCVPMCGGFVLGQVADGMARLPAARLCEWQRVEARRTAALSSGTADHIRGARRARRHRHRPAARGSRYVSAGLLLLGAALFLAHVARILPGLDRAPGRLVARHRAPREAHERRLPTRRRPRLPALWLPLCGAGSHRGQRQPADRRPGHAGFRARHHARRWWRSALPARRRDGAGSGESRPRHRR